MTRVTAPGARPGELRGVGPLPPDHPLRASLSLVVLLALGATRVAAQAPASPADAARLVERLGHVEGAFLMSEHGFGFLPATPAGGAVVDSLVALDSLAVPALVACLADTGLSAAKSRVLAPTPDLLSAGHVREVPVSRGALCFWPLVRTEWVQSRLRRRAFSEEFLAGMYVDVNRVDAAAQAHAHDVWRASLREAPAPGDGGLRRERH